MGRCVWPALRPRFVAKGPKEGGAFPEGALVKCVAYQQGGRIVKLDPPPSSLGPGPLAGIIFQRDAHRRDLFPDRQF